MFKKIYIYCFSENNVVIGQVTKVNFHKKKKLICSESNRHKNKKLQFFFNTILGVLKPNIIKQYFLVWHLLWLEKPIRARSWRFWSEGKSGSAGAKNAAGPPNKSVLVAGAWRQIKASEHSFCIFFFLPRKTSQRASTTTVSYSLKALSHETSLVKCF